MKSTVIIGNGPSLKDFDFKKIDREKYNVIGCCLAFRYWDKIDWYPDIYVNADEVVMKNPEVVDFIKRKKCKTHIVSNKLKEVWKDYPKDGTILFIEDMMCIPNTCFKYVKDLCSGTACLITSMDISLDISILGMDNDYVEFIPECKKLPENEKGVITLEITETPEHNPNYFFNDYQRKGDIYNVPRCEKVHKMSWYQSRIILDFVSIMYPESKPRVINYNLQETESIREFFLTRPLNKFDFSPMEYIETEE